MSCCGACGGQDVKTEKAEEKTEKQKPEQTQPPVEQFDPSKQ